MSMFTLVSCLTASNLPWFMGLTFQVPMQYCSLQHQTLVPSPVSSTTRCCFCFESIPSFFLELFLHWSPVAYWAPTDLGSSSFGVLSFCLFILFMGFSGQEYWRGLPFPWKESYDQPRQYIKKQRHYFANKGPSSQGYGFCSGHVWMWELDYKENWVPKNWCFWTVVLEKTLQSPLDCKEIQPVHPKGDQSWVFIGRTDVEAETPILWPPDMKSWLIWKDLDAGKDWRQEKGTTEDKIVGWYHRLNGHGFGWTPGVGDGQGGLACCGSWGRKESDTTEPLNWTELNFLIVSASVESLPFLSFIVPMFAWNVSLVSLIFLKRSLLFSSISLHCFLKKAFLISPCYSLELCVQLGIYFPLSFAFYFSSFLSCL